MLTAVAIVPSAPVVVPQLAGAAAGEIADLRHAMFAAAGALPDRWVAIGVGAADDVVGPDAAGTFAGYGADVRVGLSPDAGDVRDLPPCALITGWVRGEVAPAAHAVVHVFGDRSADDAMRRGAELRAAIDARPRPTGVLVVADGANTLTPSAPGGYDPSSITAQATLDDALATGDVVVLATASSNTGRVAWQVLAGLAGLPPRFAKELYRGAPFGVGYFVGVWDPAGRCGRLPLAGDEATGESTQ
jgi:hypothetical protein